MGHVLAGRNLTATLRECLWRHPRLTQQERSAIREVCYEGIRSLGLLEAQLEDLLVTPIKHPALRHLLLVGLAQLQFTRAKPYAIVDHAVQAAERLGQPAARGLVNAVLRNYLRRRTELEAGRWNRPECRLGFPGWWVERLQKQYPAQWQEVIAAQNRRPPLTLRVNRRRSSVDHYVAKLAAMGLAVRRLGGDAVRIDPQPVTSIPGFSEGEVSVQDAGAQWAAHLIDAQDGQRVLDACAAPGGKTGHLLEMANLHLVALDVDSERLLQVRDNLARLQLQATVIAGDAADPSTWWDGTPFQRILLDAPCSASGVVRRHPDIRWNRRPSDLRGFAERQGRILAGVWQVLESSGKLLYATCSLFREENEAVVEDFLTHHPDAHALPMPPGAPQGGLLLPDDDCDGFFYALLEKR